MKDALARLYRRQRLGVKLGLHVEEALLARLGNPHEAYPTLHVAGTNGKGSVCAMLEAILGAAGLRVGLFISPHLVAYNERMRINGEAVSDAELAPLLAAVEDAAEAVAAELGQDPTFFECSAAMALEYFRRARVDIAVIETGMGGRLDATNVVRPLVSVITTLGLEHAEYLGSTLEAIAAEKAGIIKSGVPVVCGDIEAEAMDVIRRIASERHAPLLESVRHVGVRVLKADLSGQRISIETQDCGYGLVDIPLIGEHQARNAANAVCVIDALRNCHGLDIPARAVRTGLASVRWPGRCQVLQAVPPFIVDGAHNPSGGAALAHTLRTVIGKRPLGMVIGMCSDKDIQNFLEPFRGLVRRAWAVPVPSERSMEPSAVALAVRRVLGECSVAELPEAVDSACVWAGGEGGAVCAAGSLFLVGGILELWRGRGAAQP